MIKQKDKANCSGCTACYNVCGVKAISMKEDEHGFEYPYVDDLRCIKCGKCVKVCPFDKSFLNNISADQNALAARNCNENRLNSSQSGGVFIELAEYVIKHKGSVYGVSLDENFLVVHERATNDVDIRKFQGSKYVQSHLGDAFSRIRRDLIEGYMVLFTGTACQVAGLLAYCAAKKVDTSNLLLCDVICHGVPSNKYWKDYLLWIEAHNGVKIKSVTFRDKQFGWNTNKSLIQFYDGKVLIPKYPFYNDLLLRRSCYFCPFTSVTRVSDITIGDFWGIERITSEYNDNMGVSLVILNTQKGKAIWNVLKPNFQTLDVSIEDALQQQLRYPTPLPEKKDDFEKYYSRRGFSYAVKKVHLYHDPIWWRVILGKLKRLI